MAGVFLQYDQEKMIQKFALEHDKNYIYIPFVGRRYRIDRLDGTVSWSKDFFQTEEKADYNEVMTIYDVLCYSKENCHLADEWVNVGSLASVQGGTLAKGNDFFQNAGQYFDGKTNKLALREIECQLCLDFGQVFGYWHIGHFVTPPLPLRANMARSYLAASLAGAVLRAASAASRPLCLARQYSGLYCRMD